MKAERPSVGRLVVGLMLLVPAVASGQSASMFGDARARQPLTMDRISWTYQPPVEPRTFKLHDFVTVAVDEKSQVSSEAEMDRRKKSDGAMLLRDWIAFDGLALKPAPQLSGEPGVAGEVDSKYRADGELETRETMKLEVTCEIVDIRPNGTLVLEGHESIRFNDEEWDLSLQGTVRPEDVMPDNTVLSRHVFGLRIDKQERGHVRDAYRRGWLLKMLDGVQPF